MITEENTDIFILTHKDEFKNPLDLKSSAYKIVTPYELKNESNLEVIQFNEGKYDNRLWSEFSHIFWLKDHYDFKEYVGFNHYRRFFDFKDDFSKIEGLDIEVRKPTYTYNNFHNWNIYSSPYVLQDFSDFYFKNYAEDRIMTNIWKNFLCSGKMYITNMFIMKTEEFKMMMSIVEKLLNAFNNNYYRLRTYEDVCNYVIMNHKDFIKKGEPNNTVSYQARLFAYIGERLVSAILEFFISINKNVKECDVIVTEDKYDTRF